MSKFRLKALHLIQANTINGFANYLQTDTVCYGVREATGYGHQVRFTFVGYEFLMDSSIQEDKLYYKTYKIVLDTSAPYPTYRLVHLPILDLCEGTGDRDYINFISQDIKLTPAANNWYEQYEFQLSKLVTENFADNSPAFTMINLG